MFMKYSANVEAKHLGCYTYKHHAYTRLGYSAQPVNSQAKFSMNPHTKVKITLTKQDTYSK